jgi:membrane fusion protein, multidrug efflux system
MSEAPNNQSLRRPQIMLVLALIFILGGAGYGIYWWVEGRHVETTDDAYVTGNMIRVTPRINGTVTAVYADDTDLARRGQILVRLDDADARIALAAAEAKLGNAVRNVRQLFSSADEARANVAVKEELLREATADLERRRGADLGDAVSREEVAHAESALKRSRSELELAKSRLESALAQVNATRIEQHPAVKEAEAQVREAFLTLNRCEIRAAEGGYVARRAVQLGQQVQTGATLMNIVPMQQMWVEANFKEDQLKNVRIGQPVVLVSDMYGSAVALHGKVEGLGAGTGSVFSLLPPQNATGNWIKIVQRLPVRIALDPAELSKYPLRLGLSMRVDVNTSDISGEPLAGVPVTAPRYETAVYEDEEKKASARIHEIIAANLGQAK